MDKIIDINKTNSLQSGFYMDFEKGKPSLNVTVEVQTYSDGVAQLAIVMKEPVTGNFLDLSTDDIPVDILPHLVEALQNVYSMYKAVEAAKVAS